jgi:hypothetical protein
MSKTELLVCGKHFRLSLESIRPSSHFIKRGELYRRIKSEMKTEEVVPKTADSQLTELIGDKCRQWEQIDGEYIDNSVKSGEMGRHAGTQLAVPDGMDVITADRSNIDQLRHRKVTADKQAAYYPKLFDIFDGIPKYAQLSKDSLPNLGSEHIDDDEAMSAVEVYPDSCLITTSEVIMTVSFHSSAVEKTPFPTRHHEIEVLGRQPLTALRDHLSCLSDTGGGGSDGVGGDCFLYVEGVFYVDDRGDNLSSDSSRAMLDNIHRIHDMLFKSEVTIFTPSADATRAGAGLIETHETPVVGVVYRKPAPDIRSMATTMVEDVHVVLGAKYLMCHDNHCEHFVYFSAIRGYNTRCDMKYWPSYPRTVAQGKMAKRKCKICDLLAAKYVVFGDRLAPQNPYFCCEGCEFMMHYSADGELLYDDFHIFPYYYDVPP